LLNRFVSEVALGVRAKHDPAMQSGAVWIAGADALVVVAAFVVFARRRGAPKDLGSVSDQWIAEQRAEKTSDAHR
jgi:hypothetical protein